jgi:hypothetical protein
MRVEVGTQSHFRGRDGGVQEVPVERAHQVEVIVDQVMEGAVPQPDAVAADCRRIPA